MATKYEKELINDFIKQLHSIFMHYMNSSREAVWVSFEDKMWEDARKKLEDLIDEVTYRDEDD